MIEEWPAVAVAIAGALIGGVLILDARQRRREARRRGDARFLATALERAQKGRRRRPRVDPRIQRRRYGL